MGETRNAVYSAEAFRAICKKLIPVLNDLRKVVRENEIDDYVRVSVKKDGYVSVDGFGMGGWELYSLKDGDKFVARHTYDETIEEEQE